MVSVRDASFVMVAISVVWIAVMVVCSRYCNAALSPNCATGWVAVIGASVIFGSTGIPMKSPELLTNEQVPSIHEPIIFACYTGVGIFIISFPLFVYTCIMDAGFNFKPFAILGSIDIFIINLLAFQAVNILGYSKAPAIWAGRRRDFPSSTQYIM